MSKSKEAMIARTPDQFQTSMGTFLDWLNKRIGALVAVAAALVVLTAAYGVYAYVRDSRESEWQDKYFPLEKRLTEKKRSYDEAGAQAKVAAANPKGPAATGTVASGDLSKDYGSLPQELKDFVAAAPNTHAGEMAALNAADLFLDYKNVDEADKVIAQVNKGNRVGDLLGSLVVNMKAGIAADKGDCKSAVGLWEKIAQNKNAVFLRDESKLRMGLCYETLNDAAKAESLYAEVAKKDAKDADSIAARDAERYLRLLRMKKGSGGA